MFPLTTAFFSSFLGLGVTKKNLLLSLIDSEHLQLVVRMLITSFYASGFQLLTHNGNQKMFCFVFSLIHIMVRYSLWILLLFSPSEALVISHSWRQGSDSQTNAIKCYQKTCCVNV